jgi:hypothetical protein
MKSNQAKTLVIAIALLFSGSAFANCGNDKDVGTTNCGGTGGTGGGGGNGGVGGAGGNSSSVSGAVGIGTGISSSTSGSHSNADANASGGTASAVAGSASAGNGAVTNSVTTGNVRSLSLGAAAVGSPAADTCVAYFAVGFGLVTTPIQIKSCVAAQQALLLEHFGLRDAAIARLCQEQEIADTGICPTKVKPVVTQAE